MRLEAGQVAVVTGGASGIGRGMVDAFVRRGLVVVVVDVERGQLGAAAGELRAGGAEVLEACVDVRDAAAVQRLAEQVLATYGRVDVLCNNAGVIPARRPVWEHTAHDWRWTVDVNLLGVAHGIMAFVPPMVAAGRGHVVNTSSMAGLTPIAGGGQGAYSATKHAVVGLSETLRVDLDQVAPDVGVTVLCPGPVPSRIHESARNRPADLADTGVAPGPAATTSMTALTPVPADVVGEQVVEAIELGRRYLLTDPAIADLARARIDGVLADL